MSRLGGKAAKRLSVIASVGALLILITLGLVYGPGIVAEITEPKVVGDGDSLMAGSIALKLFENKLEVETGETWISEMRAVGAYRVSIEVLAAQRKRLFASRLPWKKRDLVWMIGGTNDFTAYPKGERVEILLDSVESYFRLQHSAGYDKASCFYTDILPRETLNDPFFEEDRRKFNELVAKRLEGLAVVVPSGSNPALADPTNKDFFFDGLHLTVRGTQILVSDAMAQYRAR